MAKRVIEARVRQKKDTLANWNANPLVLEDGEQAFVVREDGSGLNFKIGDGTKRFSDLPWFTIVVNGESLVVVDTIEDMRNLPTEIIEQLEVGTLKGVQVNGYYTKGDTPAPIIYYLSDTEDDDDGGSVIEVGDVKLEHEFESVVDISYFGGNRNAVDKIVDKNKTVTSSVNTNEIEISSPISRDGEDVTVLNSSNTFFANIPDRGIFAVWSIDNANKKSLISIGNTFKQVRASAPGAGSENNHAILRSLGGEFSKFINNTVLTGSVGFSSTFTNKAAGTEGQYIDLFPLVALNNIKDIEKISYENLGSSYGRYIGNASWSPEANSHFIRLSGVPYEPLGGLQLLKGVAVVGNVFVGGQGTVNGALTGTGFGIGAGAYGITSSANYIEGASTGITFQGGFYGNKDTRPHYNTISATLNDCNTGLSNESSMYNNVDLFIIKPKKRVFIETFDELPDREVRSKGNYYKLKIIESATTETGFSVFGDSHKFDMDVFCELSEVTHAPVLVSGSAHTGTINVYDSEIQSINWYASDSNVNLNVFRSGSGTTNAILVAGSNNIITACADKIIRVEGNNNIIICNIKDQRVTVTGNNNFIISKSPISIADVGTGNIVFGRNATTTSKGLVNQATASADTATQASGATPTKAEFDALLAELRDVKTKLRTAGTLAP